MPRGWLRSRSTTQCPQCNAIIEIGELIYPTRNTNTGGDSGSHQIKYVHLHCAKGLNTNTNGTSDGEISEATTDATTLPKVDVLCKHFARGKCLFFDNCLFSHDSSATASTSNPTTRTNSNKKAGIEEILVPKKRSGYATRPRVQNRFRAGSLRRWLIDTFGRELLSSGTGILDIAGGNKAEIAFEFVNLNNIPATVVEPRALDLTKPSNWLKLGLYHHNPIFQQYIDVEYDPKTVAKAPKHLRITINAELCFAATGTIDSWPKKCSEALLLEEEEMDTTSNGIVSLSIDSSNDSARWDRAWRRSVADARSRQWTTKGLTRHENGHDTTPTSHGTTREVDNIDAQDNISSINTAQQEVIAKETATSDSIPQNEGAAIKAVPPPVEEVQDASTAWHLLTNCSVVVAMHADQATEFAVDLALRHNKPFAVVPCCVYSQEFPRRRLDSTGKVVTTYEEFIEYLKGKHADIHVAELSGFGGKNLVVYKL